MTVIHAQLIGAQALLPLQELQKLIEAARRSERIDVQMNEDDVPAWGWMRSLEQSGTFDFWKEPGEDIYSLEDGEPV